MSNLVSNPKNVVYVNGGQTYNVSAADDVINVNSNLGATEIVLPNIVNQGLDFYPKKFTVNDTGGVAGTNPITISAVGNIVNSSTSFLLNRNNVSSEIVIVSKTEYLVNTDNGGSTGVFGSGVAGQLAYFSASTVLGSLTNAQVTVLIDPMVGDSGSGGLKGLVPAPASGDAAANKYLKADGTWNAISFAGYLKADGTVPLTANWDVGAFEVTAQSLKVDGTAGAGHFHLRYQSSIPTGAANNSKLFSGATGELGWVVDSNAYAFYLDMTGNTASRTLTVPNASGTIALTTDIVNLGNSNLTSTDDARTFTLKSGGTATQNLQIKNSAGKSGFYYDGVGRVMFRTSTVPADIAGEPVNLVFGDSTNTVTANMYLTNTGISQYFAYRIYGGSALLQYIDARGGQYWQNQNGLGTADIEFRQYGNGARIYLNSGGLNTWNQFINMSAEGHQQITFSAAGSTTATKGGLIEIYNGAGDAVKSVLTGNRSQVEAVWFADGLVLGGTRGRSATPFFDVMGSGSTSATTTALFQNSASVAALTIKDDLTSTFGGIVTVPQIITTPATITVTANAGTVTRANRINKFTNSSAATMTITMSTTAALDGDMVQVRIYDFSAAAQTITWVNTENSSITVPATSNGSTTLPLTVGFQYNSATSKWRCIGSV